MRSLLTCALLLLGLSQSLAAQARPDSTAADTLAWNEADFGWTTFRVGFDVLVDYGAFGQDDDSKEQVHPNSGAAFRDGRLLLRGRFRGRRGVTWQTGIMYDEATNTLRFRQTGFTVPLNEPWGRVFIGRTKEGISLNKVLVGLYGWTIERFTFSDATIPILADGVKWFGYHEGAHLHWAVGAYVDWWDKAESYSKDEYHYASRLAWISNPSDSATALLHIGLNFRYGLPREDSVRFRSRPESFRGPFFIDTGRFPAASSFLMGPEVYYRRGLWLAGSEYYGMRTTSPETGDLLFHGGYVFVSRLLNSATRSYNPYNGTFGNVIPTRGVLDGGPGAVELALRFSYTDLDDGTVEGGTFWRVGPTLHWHLGHRLRLEFGYGYGELDRFGLIGATHFLQHRIQVQM